MGTPVPDRRLRRLLDDYGLVAECGAKHWKVKTPSGRLVGVYPFSGKGGMGVGDRAHKNLVAQARRVARGPEDGAQRR